MYIFDYVNKNDWPKQTFYRNYIYTDLKFVRFYTHNDNPITYYNLKLLISKDYSTHKKWMRIIDDEINFYKMYNLMERLIENVYRYYKVY